MADLVYELARQKAAQLLRNCWDGHLPVQLDQITREIGAAKYESDLGGSLSGLVSKAPHRHPIIVIHEADSPERRRFTWAHEIGHVVERSLSTHSAEYSFQDGRGITYDLHEFFADEFAGALLMPAEEIDRMRRSRYTHGQMAVEFGVSVKALAKRIERLAKHPETVTLLDA